MGYVVVYRRSGDVIKAKQKPKAEVVVQMDGCSAG
jgi:hypothetical protein